MIRRALLALAATVLAVAGFWIMAYGAAADTTGVVFQNVSEGAAIYEANCSSCHQAGGVGIEGAFPPLAGNSRSADAAYVADVVRNGLSGPLDVLGVSYNAVMPPVALSDAEIASVAAYVATLSSTDVTPTTVVAGPIAGDPERGEKLFAGSAGFENGGPACHACHSAGAIGFRGGGGLGPDLTNVFETLGGESGLSAWLANPASLTMQPIYADHELTENEIADVAAFLGSVRGEPRAGGVDMLLVGGALGLAALLGLMALVIRGPQETYTQRLRRQT